MNSTQGMIKRHIIGQVTANGATEVTLEVPTLEADSVVIPSLNTVGGTGGVPFITTKDVATKTLGFTSEAGDTSTYDIVLFA